MAPKLKKKYIDIFKKAKMSATDDIQSELIPFAEEIEDLESGKRSSEENQSVWQVGLVSRDFQLPLIPLKCK